MAYVRLTRPEIPLEYPPDVQLLRLALNDAGYDAEPHDIEWAWQQHSGEVCAGWLRLNGYSKRGMAQILQRHLEQSTHPEPAEDEDDNEFEDFERGVSR